ncbi:dihydrodipicolinate synthase family protein [Rhizobium cauense]|uniref:dihydrodipicolinate synthase family protein n=1 Tax=Rhizobium cauense TaxID=1166683 RepID=UPI001C6F09BD|nr:dihydrodipicolinate synthase family protein [Rhizobium cauense]MBW9113981.1 dihydrodipicolinate synthase family protein [Rhizobium cauense]
MSKNSRRHPISGNWATLLLPIADDDSIDYAALEREIDTLIEAQVDGIYSNGTAGEFHNQTEEEYDRIQELLASRCHAAGVPFVIGACQPAPAIMLSRLRRSVALEPMAIQVILPDWWPVTNLEAIDFLKGASEASEGIPLILYNPPHAKRALEPRDLSAICTPCPSVVGIKLADGDASWYEDARAHLAEFSLFVPGHHLATGKQEGIAAGAFSNVACLSPYGAQKWTDLMATDIEAALDIERRICSFMDDYIVPFRRDQGYSNAALDKLLAAVGNWAPVGTRLRWPYRSIDAHHAQRLRQAAHAIVPELFSSRLA